MRRGVILPSMLLALCLSPLSASAQTNCPNANPYDSLPDDAEINACLARGGVVTLRGHAPGGPEFYWISQPLNLAVSGTTLTSGTPGERVELFATNDLYGPMLQAAGGVNNYTISEINFAGGVYSRTRRDECQGYRAFGSNLVLAGDGFVVRNVETAGAMCGTALGVDGSNFEITGVNAYLNGIPADEPHNAPEPWSDGITLGRCDGGYVHDNTLSDNTDVDIVIGGGTNCRVQNNTINHNYKHAFAGIHVTNFVGEGNGNHSGSSFSGNVVNASTDKLSFGIVVGPHPWDDNLNDSDNGSVTSNQMAGSVVNLAIDGTDAGTVTGNSVSGAQGSYGYHCSISSNYTAAHYGGTVIQQSPIPLGLNYDRQTCGFE
jgi:parallel beta-helix repeat protein